MSSTCCDADCDLTDMEEISLPPQSPFFPPPSPLTDSWSEKYCCTLNLEEIVKYNKNSINFIPFLVIYCCLSFFFPVHLFLNWVLTQFLERCPTVSIPYGWLIRKSFLFFGVIALKKQRKKLLPHGLYFLYPTCIMLPHTNKHTDITFPLARSIESTNLLDLWSSMIEFFWILLIYLIIGTKLYSISYMQDDRMWRNFSNTKLWLKMLQSSQSYISRLMGSL